MPVLAVEFGAATGRGEIQENQVTSRGLGYYSEKEQGKILVDCYEDIMAAGLSGGCVYSWQDEWFKHTWNTMYAVDLSRNIYWEDAQTNDQHFGLLAFDCGENALNSCTINCGKAITYRFPFLFRLITRRSR